MKLKEYILDLLQNHECVIFPDFGGFILNPEPSRYDQLQHKFYPPLKRVSFNRNLKKNDGLLIQAVSEGEGTTFQEAAQLVANIKQKWNEELKEKGFLNLPGLGYFKWSSSNILSFEADQQTSFGLDSFGLESFHALPLAQEKKEVIPVVPMQEKSTTTNTIETATATGKRKRPWAYVAAGVFALPVLGYAAWIASSSGVFDTHQQFHYSDLNPFSERVCEVYTPRASAYTFQGIEEASPFALPALKDIQSPTAEVKFLEKEAGAVIVRLSTEEKTDHTKNSALSESALGQGNFHVIAGCFSVKTNADDLAKKLQKKGYSSARILDKDGRLYRVTAGAFQNQLDASVALRDFRVLENKGAWITKK